MKRIRLNKFVKVTEATLLIEFFCDCNCSAELGSWSSYELKLLILRMHILSLSLNKRDHLSLEAILQPFSCNFLYVRVFSKRPIKMRYCLFSSNCILIKAFYGGQERYRETNNRQSIFVFGHITQFKSIFIPFLWQ